MIFALGLLSAVLAAQQQAPVFRAEAKLVEVTVTVLDKKGNAVAGLTQSDFVLQDGGKTRSIAFFRFDGLPPKPAQAPRATPGVFTNRADEGGAAPPTITALVLDTLNTPQEQNTVVRAQMMRYLKALGPASRLAIFIMGRELRIVCDFTSDGDALRARIAKLALEAPPETATDYTLSVIEAEQFVNLFEGTEVSEFVEGAVRARLEAEGMSNAAARRNRMDTSLAAMEALGRRLAGIPGRKNLVWMSAGFSMASVTGSLGMGVRGQVQNFEGKVRQTSRRLAQDGVVLYIVDPGGFEFPKESSAEYPAQLPSTSRDRTGRFEPQVESDDMSADPRAAMSLMTSVTGGRYLYNTNDLTVGFRQALADLRGSYTLGFYTEAADDKWHKLNVKVNRSGVDVRHRQGYLAEAAPAQPVEWDEAAWNAAFSDPVGSSMIPLSAKCERAASGEISLALSIEPGSLNFQREGENLSADVQVALWDRSERFQIAAIKPSAPAAQFDELRSQGVVYRRQWKPPQGAATIRAIVRDKRTGQYGTLDIPVSRVPAAAR